MSSAENGLSTAGWSLWGGAADRMQFFICLFACLFFFGGGEGIYVDGFAAYRVAKWCRYWCVGTRNRFWVQLGWLVLGPFGVLGDEGCILCSCLHYLASLGYRGIRQGLFWLCMGICWGFPVHWCLCPWAVWCFSGAVDRDVRLRLVLLSMILLFPNYSSFWG